MTAEHITLGKIEEQIYHDRVAREIEVDSLLVHETFEAPTSPENRFILNLLGSVQDRDILDLGCGAGESSVYFSLKGGNVTAMDISPEMVKIGEKLATKHNVKIKWMVNDASELPFEDESFHIVYGNGVLHHLANVNKTLRETKRVLKKGGTAVFIEPLAHNPVINIYRKMAKDVRTEDERPFRMKELEEHFLKVFKAANHEEFWFLTLWLFIRFFIFERVDPNKDRYWKRVVREHKKIGDLYSKLERMDRKLLSHFPFLKKYCWNTVMYVFKTG